MVKESMHAFIDVVRMMKQQDQLTLSNLKCVNPC